MSNQVILFGTGVGGKMAFEYFGSENIACFSSNNPGRIGKKFMGLDVVAPQRLPELSKGADVVIAIAENRKMIFTIATQLKRMGIENWSIFLDIRQKYESSAHFLNRRQRNIFAEQESFWNVRYAQLGYLIRHAEDGTLAGFESMLQTLESGCGARELSPASGALRDRQLWIADIAWRFLARIQKSTGVTPFMEGGTLLGAVRHGGFIPWDEDMDFDVLHSDYLRLAEYFSACRDVELFYLSPFQNRAIWKTAEGKPYERTEKTFLICCHCGCMGVFCNTGAERLDDNLHVCDFFHMCFFPDDMTPERYVSEAERWIALQKTDPFSVEGLVLEEMKNNMKYPEKSDKIGYSYDIRSSLYYLSYERNYYTNSARLWNARDIYPLVSMEFEGHSFMAPNRPNRVLQVFFGPDYMSLPNDFGFQTHMGHNQPVTSFDW